MPDKKNEKKNGMRGMFRRKKSDEKTKPSNGTESKPQEEGQRPTPRRTYTPRYAERDMILSVPVEDRPDLVAKVKENNLRRVCSDIGFSTGSASRASSSHSRSTSLNLSALSTHPNLHVSRNAALDPATPGSSGSSLRHSMMPRSSSTPTVPLQQSANALDLQWRGLSYNGPANFPQRPRPRASQSIANIPQMIPESKIEHVDHALNEVETSEDGDNADNDDESRASTPSSVYSPEFGRRPIPPPARPRAYFSHKGPLPDLRAKKAEQGKGKEAAKDWDNDESRARGIYNHPPSNRASYESVSNYVISTKPLRAAQTAPARLPPPPPPSNSDSSVSDSPKISAQHQKDSRAPSLTESESNGTDRSSYYNNGSPRTSSVSTVLTAHSGAEDGKTEKAVKLDDQSDISAKTYSEDESCDLRHVETVKRADVEVRGR